VLFYFTSMLFFGIGVTVSYQLFQSFGAATIIAVGIGYILVGLYYFSFRKAFLHK